MSRGDRGRSEVYAAEAQAFEGCGLDIQMPFEDLCALATSVTSASWWPHGEVVVRRARSDARRSWARFPHGQVPAIHIAADQYNRWTVLHELAHVLAGFRQGHGPVFRRAEVDLVGHCVGQREADWLAEAFAGFGLVLAERTWPAPALRGGPIVL